MHTFQRLGRSRPPRWGRNPMLFAFNACLAKAARMWSKKIYKGSYHSLCFVVHKHPSCSNDQGAGTKARAPHLLLEIVPS